MPHAHGHYLHGTSVTSIGNEIHDNAGAGLSLRDYTQDSFFIDNKIYRNSMGIYYIGAGNDVFDGNLVTENGLCIQPYGMIGVYIGPNHRADSRRIPYSGTTRFITT
jgi:parallel beta-helix repeat protein